MTIEQVDFRYTSMDEFNILGIDLGDEISISLLNFSDKIRIQCYKMMMSEEVIKELGIVDKFGYFNTICNSILTEIDENKPLLVILREANEEIDTVLKCYLENFEVEYLCVTDETIEKQFSVPRNRAIILDAMQVADELVKDGEGFLVRSVILSIYGFSKILESQDVINKISKEAGI